MQLAGVALVSVPIHQTGLHNYMRQTKIHISIGLLVQCLAFLQVAASCIVSSHAGVTLMHGPCTRTAGMELCAPLFMGTTHAPRHS